MSESDSWQHVERARHGVFGTVHSQRGVDLVPVVYAVADQTVFIPVDTVKDKTTTGLQRLANLSNDPRCTLLVDSYDDDWTRLWWVRVNGEGRVAILSEAKRFRPLLADRYPQYADPATIELGIVLTPTGVTGWRAAAG